MIGAACPVLTSTCLRMEAALKMTSEFTRTNLNIRNKLKVQTGYHNIGISEVSTELK